MDLLIESQRQLRGQMAACRTAAQQKKEKKPKVSLVSPLPQYIGKRSCGGGMKKKNLTIHVSQLLFYFNASKEKTISNFQG